MPASPEGPSSPCSEYLIFKSAMTDLHCRVVGLQSTALLSLLIAHISAPGAAPGTSRFQNEHSPVELRRDDISLLLFVSSRDCVRFFYPANRLCSLDLRCRDLDLGQGTGLLGFEPRFTESKSVVLPVRRLAKDMHEPGFEPRTKRLSSVRTTVVLFVRITVVAVIQTVIFFLHVLKGENRTLQGLEPATLRRRASVFKTDRFPIRVTSILAAQVGFEPTPIPLTADRSTS